MRDTHSPLGHLPPLLLLVLLFSQESIFVRRKNAGGLVVDAVVIVVSVQVAQHSAIRERENTIPMAAAGSPPSSVVNSSGTPDSWSK